jgi:Gpi18-like mannosyltransferase
MSWMMNKSLRALIFIWIGWVIILPAFQAWALMRFVPERPDKALGWTAEQTMPGAQSDKIYLNDPFMNQQVSWDSEYYLSIATMGYQDPAVYTCTINGAKLSNSSAFMPLYPYLMWLLSFPLKVFQLTPIATATLAGVLVSTLGALGGAVALFSLARDKLGEQGALRTAFYLLIFPTGLFLAQVYTEGLFVGLAFGSLAFLARKKVLPAAILAMFATLTRAVGVALAVPIALFALQSLIQDKRLTHRVLVNFCLAFACVAVYLIWSYSTNGQAFKLVQEACFSRYSFNFNKSIEGWRYAWRDAFRGYPQMTAYYLLEFGGIALGVIACLFMLRSYPYETLFSLAVIIISLTSGVPRGMHRYILTAPVVFLFLGKLGKNDAFDRLWTILSILLLGVLSILFAADFWVG